MSLEKIHLYKLHLLYLLDAGTYNQKTKPFFHADTLKYIFLTCLIYIFKEFI